MIVHWDVEQGTPEWDALRAGKMTASKASKLVTPTGRPSSQYLGEIGRLIAERLGLQDPEPVPQTYWMERGTEMEEEARNCFQLFTGNSVTKCGFIESDDGLIGVSPDGIIDGDELIPLEVKVPMPSTHITWMMEQDRGDGMPKQHIAQVHFAMAVTEAPYAYFMSYNPDLPPVLHKVERGDYTKATLEAMESYRADFLKTLAIAKGES